MTKLNLKSVVKPNVQEVLSLEEYLELAKTDPSMYASPHERLLKAIGEPIVVDTREDQRLGRLHNNAIIRTYAPFKDFYGIEKIVDQIVSFLKCAAQGLEETRQILYLLGPVSGGKSQLAERIKELMAKEPFYALAVKKADGLQISPIHENPLGLFTKEHAEQLNIPARYFNGLYSPWASKRIEEFDHDLSKFKVVKMYPNANKLIAISTTEPGDDTNQDISSLIGKTSIRQIENYEQDDSDGYSYCGGLCRGNRGTMEFVEMFKAPIKTLNPLLTATQEHRYNPTEPGLGAIPFEGLILAHSNESEWDVFKSNKANEAFLDRTRVIKVPYVLQYSEVAKVQQKLLKQSELANAPIAPRTLNLLAKFMTLTRISNPENSNIFHKMKVYNGEDIKATEPRVKSLMDYKANADHTEGYFGMSNRTGLAILAATFNKDVSEVSANSVHLIYEIDKYIDKTYTHPKEAEVKNTYLSFLKEYLIPEEITELGKDLAKANLEAHREYGQDLFDRYVYYANAYDQQVDYRDPETGELLDYDALDKWLSGLERKIGGIASKEFRADVVKFCLRYHREHGKNPAWDCYTPMKDVIEANILSKTEDLLPMMSFNKKASKEDEKKHKDFVDRMVLMGYTEKQVKLLVDWWNKAKKTK